MNSRDSGILLQFDEERRTDLILEKIHGTYEPFSDALSGLDWEIGNLSLALLSFSESTIDFLALAKKGNRVVTAKNRIEFSSLLSLEGIDFSDLEDSLPERLKPYLTRASQGTGKGIPPATWGAIIGALKALRPHLLADIDRLISLRRFSGYHFKGRFSEILSLEREALGISLDIFSGGAQLRDRVLREWAPKEAFVEKVDDANLEGVLSKPETANSIFLNGIPNRFLQEESAIQHDLFNWEGITPHHDAGLSVFEQGDRHLEVIYANRNDLEHTLGVDLIYYNSSYELFVLVQYKLMAKEGDLTVYRPDSQLRVELQRMDSFQTSFASAGPIQAHNEFRLNSDGFMMKLVPNQGLKPSSGELIKGMYLSREYMNFLIGPNGPKGIKGGTKITFGSAPRYFTNSQFSGLVHDGLIGTRANQSSILKDLIKEFYESGRAVMLAHETRKI